MTGPLLESLEPRVFLSTTYSDAAPTVLAEGARTDVVVIGDIDGDGADDILAANQTVVVTVRSGFQTQGAIVVSGRTGERIYSYSDGVFGEPGLDQTGHRFGAAVEALGDITGDGVPDFAISAPSRESGVVYQYSGADGSLVRMLEGDPTFISFGNDLANLGDITGDGVPDLGVAIGGQSFRPPAGVGLIQAFSGSDGSALYRTDTTSNEFDLGNVITRVGDINGDGFVDWSSGDGKVHSGVNGVHIVTLDISPPESLPVIVAPIGDIDGDGVPDIAGASRLSPSIEAFSGATGNVIRTFVTLDMELFGDFIGIHDVNNDGVRDLAVGVPLKRFELPFLPPTNPTRMVPIGAVQVYSGADGEMLVELTDRTVSARDDTAEIGNQLGKRLAFGDVTGDGVMDIIAMAEQSGDDGRVSGDGQIHRFRGLSDAAAPAPPAGFTGDSTDDFVVSRDPDGHIVVQERVFLEWETFTVRDAEGRAFVADEGSVRTTVEGADRYIAFLDGGSLRVLQRSGDAWVVQSVEAAPIQRDLISTKRPVRSPAFAGLSADGDVIVVSRSDDGTWRGVNASARAANSGFPIPALVSDLVFFGSRWDAIHFGGLTDAGEIGVVWLAPAETDWLGHVISMPGNAPLSDLGATSTPWGSLNIAGITPDGDVGNYWWSPGLRHWEYRTLQGKVASDSFVSGSLQVFANAWSLNIVGVTQDGEVGAFYKLRSSEWKFDVLSLRADAPHQQIAEIFGARTAGSTMQIATVDEAGNVGLFQWWPGIPKTWLFQQLS